MEHLGGLIHRMPRTAFAFLVGCVAISALPPLNGFVSEWLTFQAILLRPDLPQWGLKLADPGRRRAAGAVRRAGRGLLRASAFGITFLGRPRTAGRGAGARGRSLLARARCSAVAALCLLAGIFPGVVIDALAPVVQALLGARMPTQLGLPWLSIVPVAGGAQLLQRPAGLRSSSRPSAWLTVAGDPPLRLARACGGRRRGIAAFPTRGRLRSTPPRSFAQPIRRVFGAVVFRAREMVDHAAARRHRARRASSRRIRDPIWDALYAPVGRVRSARGGRAEPCCSSSPSAAISASSSSRWSACCWRSRYGSDRRRSLIAGRADGAGAAAGAAAHRAGAQGEGAAAAPARRLRCCSRIATCAGCSARRWCWPRTPPGCSAPRPI